MSTPPSDNQFLFLMRGADWDKDLSPSEAQSGMEAMLAWLNELTERGIVSGGQPLDFKGFVVSERDGVVTDGPYVESKEAVGGYILVHARTMAEAVDAARACPVLKYGLQIEVRPTLLNCAIMDEFDLQYYKPAEQVI